jgi:hypothetical protein
MGQAKRRRNPDPNYGKPDSRLRQVRLLNPDDHEHIPGTVVLNSSGASISGSLPLGNVHEAVEIGSTACRKIGTHPIRRPREDIFLPKQNALSP